MELKEFVKNTLLSISEGVEEASKERHKRIGHNSGKFSLNSWGDNNEGKFVNFDVAVTTKSEKSGAVKGEAKIYIASGGLEGEIKSGVEHISRVKFKVMYDERSS